MRPFAIICIALLYLSCDKTEKQEPNLFEVTNSNVGLVTDSTLVKNLKTIFKRDSIVSYKEDDSFIGGLNPINVYEKNSNHLLSIFPTDALDSTAAIDYIKLIDPRYNTRKGINNQSYYLDIRKNYKISEIKNELNTIKLQIDTINVYFVINKKSLQRNFDFGIKIDATQIPDSTKIDAFIKYF